MISLHRLGHQAEEFLLNPDLILTVEATPDTVIALTTGARVVVVESPERVAALVRAWRTGILADALWPAAGAPPMLTAIEGTGPPADHQGR